MTRTNPPRRFRQIALHATRVLLFVLVILLIRLHHARTTLQQNSARQTPINLERLRKFYPAAESVAANQRGRGGRDVFGEDGEPLGYVLQTSPDSDHLIGFSGPTNTLIAFSRDDRIVGVDVLSSGDTRDHVRQVLQDDAFLNSFHGLTWEEASKRTDVDAVSGATLTSLTIQESIIYRLSGGRPSLRFPDPPNVDDVIVLMKSADSLQQDPLHSSLWRVKDARGAELGAVLRSSPHADNIVGYQGPTEALIGFDSKGRAVGIAIGKTYDNEQYVKYVREDEYFRTMFNGLMLDELAAIDLKEAEVEGVSGATMTSMAVAEGLLVAAEQHRRAANVVTRPDKSILRWTPRDAGTAAVIVVGLAIALTSLRGKKSVRICFQLMLIGYLGLINGDMLSQAMLVGWARNGVPWSSAGGLVLLTMVALLLPIASRRNVYCSHLCPHGAAQHLLKDRLRWRLRLPRWSTRTLKVIPALLLVWCVIVAMTSLSFSLVDIEPFDAWVFRVAGWATITIAVVGLLASLFVPMAYCRFGCPTGAMLSFLRFNAQSDRWSWRDWTAVALVALAIGLWLSP